MNFSEIVQGDATKYANQVEEITYVPIIPKVALTCSHDSILRANSDLYEALEVESLLFED